MGEYFETVMYPNIFQEHNHYYANQKFTDNFDFYRIKLLPEELTSPNLNSVIRNKFMPEISCRIHDSYLMEICNKFDNILILDIEMDLGNAGSSTKI